MTRIELEAMMKADPNEIMAHPFTGKPATVSEVLRAVLRGEGAAVHPIAPQPGQPGYQAGPNITISQEAVNALGEQQYQELKQTGFIQGLTNSDNGRAFVHVSQGGSIQVQRSFNPETGAVEAGRGLDMRDFFDPSAGS